MKKIFNTKLLLYCLIIITALSSTYCNNKDMESKKHKQASKSNNKTFNFTPRDNTIILSTLDWEPYIGQNLKNYGYVNEIVSEAFKRVGLKVKVKFFPWSRTVMLSERGIVDGHFPEYFDEGRLKKWIFSDPFPGGPVGLLKRKESNIQYKIDPRKNQLKALRSISSYKIGVVRNYINTADFDRAAALNIPEDTSEMEKQKIILNKFLKIEKANDDESTIKMLIHKHVDLIFIDKYVAFYLIKTKFKISKAYFEFIEPPLQINPLYICFSHKSPNFSEKCKLFNKGLSIIKKDGTLTKIMQKHSFK